MVVVGTVAWIMVSSDTEASPRFTRLSNPGTRVVRLAAVQRRELLRLGLAGELRLLRDHPRYRLYVDTSTAGKTCYLTSQTTFRPSGFGVIACPSAGGSAFPSEQAPILDLSPLVKAPGAAFPHAQAVVGFAADGVAAAGVIDWKGKAHRVLVRRNTYVSTAFAGVAARAIVAYDSSGKVVYRHGFTP